MQHETAPFPPVGPPRASMAGSGRSRGSPLRRGEARQADYAERFNTLLFSRPSVEAITWWDLRDAGWQGAPGGLVRPSDAEASLRTAARPDQGPVV